MTPLSFCWLLTASWHQFQTSVAILFFRQREDGAHIHRRGFRREMDDNDFKICDQRHDGQREDDPASGVEAEQGDERGEQAQAVKFCEIGMRGRIFSEADVAGENGARLRQHDERDERPGLRYDRFAQQKGGGEDEQVINHVRHAVVAAERGRGDAVAPGEDAVINVRQRAGDQDRQINPARNMRQRARQGDRAEQQPQGGEREGKVAFHSVCRIINMLITRIFLLPMHLIDHETAKRYHSYYFHDA